MKLLQALLHFFKPKKDPHPEGDFGTELQSLPGRVPRGLSTTKIPPPQSDSDSDSTDHNDLPVNPAKKADNITPSKPRVRHYALT